MKARRTALSAALLAGLCSTLFFAGAAGAATYTWNGTQDSNWSNTANWQSGTMPSSGTTYTGGRLNVYSTPNALNYTASQGTTTFIGANASRGLYIYPGGTMNITGGEFSTAGNNGAYGDIIGLFSGGGSIATLTVSGSGIYVGSSDTVNTNNYGNGTIIGYATSGAFNAVLNVSGNGWADLPSGLVMGDNFTGTGGTSTVNLSGGTLTTNAVTQILGSITANFNFDGGLLVATTNMTAQD